MSELHPKFDVMSHDRRFGLGIGDSAKVCVVIADVGDLSGERFWVEITAADSGSYEGRVANELTHSGAHGLRFGDLISFDYRHVYEVVLQSEVADLRRTVLGEMVEPGFTNITQKASDENQSQPGAASNAE